MTDARRPDALAEPELELDVSLLARLPLDDKAGPAARISSARAAAMVDAAIAAAAVEVAPPARTGLRARFEALGPAARAFALAAAVMLMFVGGAAAAKLAAWAIDARVASTADVSRAEPAAQRAGSERGAEPATPAQSVDAPTPMLAPAAEPAGEPATELAAELAAEPAAPEPAATSAPRPRERERERVLEDLLQRANRERAAGRFRQAASLYAHVYEREPRSLSAYVARIAAGSIELEHLARPARARVLFEAALRASPRGALDLEARQGLVLALRDLGARDAEERALRALIAAHPTRPAAVRARARLAELAP